jgi:hypothetical protein
MAYSVIEVANALNLECEFIPGRDKGLMRRQMWDTYLCQRLVALIDETAASVVTFDGVVPYPGLVAAKFARPHISLVWIRRGMWQKKPQGVLLGLQSKLMDYVIEPGDIAREADFGPTRDRKEALLVDPVTLYRSDRTLSRVEARQKLGLDLERPAVLVQMGVGSTDLDARISAVFRGLQSWPNLQIVMARMPVDQHGNSLVPKGMTVRLIRHFPLADLLHGFDAAVCAAGYNSVHEVIPAGLPTLFIANNRGTDNQDARARHCAELGLSLFANNDSLDEIEYQAAKLVSPTLRLTIRTQCQSIQTFKGASKIASLLTTMTDDSYAALIEKRYHYQRFLAFAANLRSPRFYVKRLVNAALRALAIGFRTLFPHEKEDAALGEVIFSDSRNHLVLDKYIRNPERFEHLLENASPKYLGERKAIAKRAYGEFDSTPITESIEIQSFFRFAS